MKRSLLLIATVGILSACNTQSKSEKTAEATADTVSMDTSMTTRMPKISKIWASDTLVQTPESVFFNEADSVLYVSCIGGVPPTAKDGDGYISKLSPEDGSIIDLKWITGLNAPKGMGVSDGKLYVTDIDVIVEIDIAEGKILKKHKVEGAAFLNDIDVSDAGDVYISDMNTQKILLLKDGVVSTFIESVEFNGPNGISLKGDKLMLSTSGSGNFYEIDRGDKSYKVVTDSIFGGDGVEQSDDDYLVSSWNGELYFVTADGEKSKLLDTKGIANTADIEFVAATNTIFVPTFFGNQVVAYKLEK